MPFRPKNLHQEKSLYEAKYWNQYAFLLKHQLSTDILIIYLSNVKRLYLFLLRCHLPPKMFFVSSLKRRVKIWGHRSVICVLKYAPFVGIVPHDSAVRKISHIFQYYKSTTCNTHKTPRINTYISK